MLPPHDLGARLLSLARAAIEEALGRGSAAPPVTPSLDAIGATFVTLRQRGDLRGCIGSVSASRPLSDDVRANAVAAAFQDPRFPPLKPAELSQLTIEVSLLGPQEAFYAASESDALAQLRPGRDGVVLEYRRHRSTFLPQVWDDLPEPKAFMAALKRKAGLPADFWSDEIRLSRYTVDKFAEAEA